MTWSEEAPRLRRYWTLPIDRPIRYKRSADYVEHFREVLNTAVYDRLRSGHIAVSMSGGLDSVAVAATATELLSQRTEPSDLRAHTLVYDRLLPDDQERYYAGLAARALGIPIDYRVLDDYRLYERWGQAELQRPEPASDPLLAIFVDLLKAAASHSRVMLDGDGGDPVLWQSLVVDLVGTVPLRQLIVDMGEHVLLWHRVPPLGVRSRLMAMLKSRMGGHTWRPPYPQWLSREFEERFGLYARWERHYAEQENPQHRRVHPTRDAAYQQFLSPIWSRLFENQDTGEDCHPDRGAPPLLRHSPRQIRFGAATGAVVCTEDRVASGAAKGRAGLRTMASEESAGGRSARRASSDSARRHLSRSFLCRSLPKMLMEVRFRKRSSLAT